MAQTNPGILIFALGTFALLWRTRRGMKTRAATAQLWNVLWKFCAYPGRNPYLSSDGTRLYWLSPFFFNTTFVPVPTS